MTYIRREYRRGEDMGMAQMYNGIKYMFGFDVTEGVTRKKKCLIN